jgi:hypothetical protein
MDKFLDTYDHPKLNQEDINHMNRSIAQNEIEATIVSQERKVQDLMVSAEFYQTFFYYFFLFFFLIFISIISLKKN